MKSKITHKHVFSIMLLCILFFASIGVTLAREDSLFTKSANPSSSGSQNSGVGMAYRSASVDTQTIEETAVVAGEFLVKFDDATTKSSIGSTLKGLDATILRTYDMLGLYLVRLNNPPATVKAGVTLLEDNAQIKYAAPNYIRKVNLVPNDPLFDYQWHLQNTGQLDGTSGCDISATGAWDVTTGNRNTVVAIIDTGIDYTHPDLAANMWMNAGEIPGNGVDDDENGYVDDVYGIDTVNHDSDPIDDFGHGTHCAGIIGAVGNNNVGVTGINWATSIMALKSFNSLGEGEDANIIECINYLIVMNVLFGVNVRVCSNSWGGGEYDPALYDAIYIAGLFDILFVFSAGNDSIDNDVSLTYPPNYDLYNMITVASTDNSDQLSSFSNWGVKTVDVGAPGSMIFSTMPTYHVTLTDYGFSINYGYNYMDGTSMACPQVAGLAALLMVSDPTLSSFQVKTRILSTVDPVPALVGKVLSGGRINATRALTTTDTSMHLQIIEPATNSELIRNAQLDVSVWLTTTTDPILGADVQATFSNGESSVTLRDDGISPDEWMGDGIYTASFSPLITGSLTVQVNAWARGYTPASASVITTVKNVVDYDIFWEPYQWIEISESSFGGGLGDESSTTLISPFPINFYGTSYFDLTIGSNGIINFENKHIGYINTPIPYPNYYDTHGFIAAFWDDLNMRPSTASGAVYCGVFGTSPNRYLVVEWKDVQHYVNVGTATFEVIFFENTNDIVFQYQDVYFGNSAIDRGTGATIGMQYNEHWGVEYSYLSESVDNNYALRFVPVDTDYAVYNVASWIMQEPAFSTYYVNTGSSLDNEGLGFVYVRSVNDQNNVSQSNSQFIDQATGSPLFAGDVVVSGGKFSNILMSYYENEGLARVWLSKNATHFRFISTLTNQIVYAIEKSTYIPSQKDYFVIQSFRDYDGRAVLSLWGLSEYGTCASGVCFTNFVWPNIADFNMNYYIYSWEDLNLDGYLTPNEIAFVTSGI